MAMRGKPPIPQFDGRLAASTHCPGPYGASRSALVTSGLLTLGLGCLLGLGCGGGEKLPAYVPIQGRVTFAGKALQNGEVIYAPLRQGSGRPARGEIDENGRFVLITSAGIPGVVHGEYRIGVTSYKARERAGDDPRKDPAKDPAQHARTVEFGSEPAVPARYLDVAESGLTDTVDKAHPGFKQIDLVP